MTRELKFVLTEDEVDQLMWLVEGNNAFEHLARVLQIQIDNQED